MVENSPTFVGGEIVEAACRSRRQKREKHVVLGIEVVHGEPACEGLSRGIVGKIDIADGDDAAVEDCLAP